MKNKNLLDQFFLVDDQIIDRLVNLAGLTKKDVVVEIGAGPGNVTAKIARRAGKVIALEIDPKFKKKLLTLPGNVEVVWGDALVFLKTQNRLEKIIASLPSSLVEPVFSRLMTLEFKQAALLIPLKFYSKLISPLYSLFFTTELVTKVSKSAFWPRPKTNWALVQVVPGSNAGFFQKYLASHPLAKKENACREALILWYQKQGKRLTKNEARAMLKKTNKTLC